MNVNLQVVDLEQHINGMMYVEQGVTKDRHYTIYIYISFMQFIPVYVGLAQARPTYTCTQAQVTTNHGTEQ